jgi:hypothetical protein
MEFYEYTIIALSIIIIGVFIRFYYISEERLKRKEDRLRKAQILRMKRRREAELKQEMDEIDWDINSSPNNKRD